MDELTAKTYRSLEWERLKSYLTAEAESDCGRKLCIGLEPVDSFEETARLLDETEEIVYMIQARSGFSAAGLPTLDEQLSRLQAGASLTAQDFLQIKSLLKISGLIKAGISLLPQESFPRITRYEKLLVSLPSLVAVIDNVIDDGANVLDTASDLLFQLRQEAARLQSQISSELQKIIQSSSQSKALQEPIYTIRNGRFVVPVNASHRAVIPGIVHDSSASGLTIYVEPLAVLELANKKRLKESEIEREIARILDELAERIRGHHDELENSYRTVGCLDAISARARLALKYDGRKPELIKNDVTSFVYRQARHPLLILQSDKESVIANDIDIGVQNKLERTLIITGPNTGGKTVLLKTIGIFALMMRAGLLLPTAQGSSATIFAEVLADIGDEQSLEQSLSTFSSHMQNIVRIVARSRQGTLVLLDEVGAGTDPREGAALAKALLEHLTASGAMTIATTHFSELKTMAYSEPIYVNGSLEFDEITLSPSYRLRLGIPGSSKATTIAHRLGLNEAVINRANELLETDKEDLQTTIELLEERLATLRNKDEELALAIEEAKAQKDLYEKQLHDENQKAERTRTNLAAKLEEEFNLSRDYVRHLIADLQKEPSIAKAQKVQKELATLRKELGWLEQRPDAVFESKNRLQPGQSVKVRSLNQRGVLQSVDEKKGAEQESVAHVKAGNLTLKVPLSDLELLSDSKQDSSLGKQSARKGSHRNARSHAPYTSDATNIAHSNQVRVFVRTGDNTIDLRGQRVDEALSRLDQFINEAIVHERSPVMIIHGHGTGALRNAVRDALASNNSLERIRPGENYEGGDGVTIVEI